MVQNAGKKLVFLYLIILLLLIVIGFLFYQLYDVRNVFNSFFNNGSEPVKRSKDRASVEYEKPFSRKSNYVLNSRGYTQWDPYTEMERMNEQINQVLKLTLERFHAHESKDDFQRFDFNLSAKVAEDSNYFVLNIPIPSVNPESIEVNISEKQLQLKGVSEESVEEKDSKGKVIQSEVKSTSFFRSIAFPEKVDPSSLEKKIENGMLQIKLRKLSAKD